MSLAQNEDFLKAAFRGQLRGEVKKLEALNAGYDKNGDGKVTIAEFKRVMARTSHLSDEAIEDMVKTADVDKDG